MQSTMNAETAPESAGHNRRRRYVINAAFQWKYALTISLLVMMTSSILSCILYGLLHHQARMRLINPQTYTAEVSLVILLFALGFSAVTAAAVGLWCLIASHRMCGPLFVLQCHLMEVARGRFPTLRPIRRKDEFKELHAVFANAVEALKQQKRSELAALLEALNTAESALDGHDETRRAALESLTSQLKLLRDAAAEMLGEEVCDLKTPLSPKPRTSRPTLVQAGS